MFCHPADLISVNFIVCEKIDDSDGGAVSAHRIIDTFVVREIVPPEFEIVAVHIGLLLRFDNRAPRDHRAEILLVYPDGTTIPVIKDIQMPESDAKPIVQSSPDGSANSPASYSVLTGIRLGVQQLGRHYLQAWVDGNLVAVEPITFALRSWLD